MQEMSNVLIAFEKSNGEKKDLPVGFQQIQCHMIFDVVPYLILSGSHVL
jgi:hypothetical protein